MSILSCCGFSSPNYRMFVHLKHRKCVAKLLASVSLWSLDERRGEKIIQHNLSTLNNQQAFLLLKLLLLNYRHQPWSFTWHFAPPGSKNLQKASAKSDLLPSVNGSLSYLWKPALGFSAKPLSGLIYAANACSSLEFKLHLGSLLSKVLHDICNSGG